MAILRGGHPIKPAESWDELLRTSLPVTEDDFARFLHSLDNIGAAYHLDDDPADCITQDPVSGDLVPSFSPAQVTYLRAAIASAYQHSIDVWAVASSECWPACIQPDDDDEGDDMPANMPESVSRLISL